MIRGFTLLELLLVIGGLVILATFSVPISVQFFQRQVLDEATENIVNYIEQAHIQAISGKNDNSHGVYVELNSLTLFEGRSYATRNGVEDYIYLFSTGIHSLSSGEIVFENGTGRALAKENFILELGTFQKQINTNGIGSAYVE